MSENQLFRESFHSFEVNADFSEAVVVMRDSSRLVLRHRVGERWAKAVGADGMGKEAGLAGQVLASIVMFRLNAKHLDIDFNDGSRWEVSFRDANRRH